MKKLLGYGYRIVYWFKELFEKIHLLIVFCEVGLLFVSARRIISELDSAHMHEFGDLTLFVVLCTFLIVDLLVRLRRYRRGYRFGGLLTFFKPPLRDEQQLLKRMRELRARGLQGHLIAADEIARRNAAQIIATESATVFSVKTLGTTDTEWAHAEAEYLNAWLSRFPMAVWWLPLTASNASQPASASACCFSVIVPICEDSYQMIRKGHLNTALAHIDAEAAAFATTGHSGAYPKRIRWLAYVQGLTEGAGADTAGDLSPLFYCSVEHLAFLLRHFYPDAALAAKQWNFSIICEASNNAQRHALGLLGFTQTKYFRLHRGSSAEGPVESPSGFSVCELNVEPTATVRTAGALPLQRFIETTLAEEKAPEGKPAPAVNNENKIKSDEVQTKQGQADKTTEKTAEIGKSTASPAPSH